MNAGDSDGTYGAVDGAEANLVEGHGSTRTYRTSFGSNGRTATDAVIATVSAAAGAGPLELPPIYAAVDPDALDRLFDSPSADPGSPHCSVTFEYADHLVTVDDGGTVAVEPTDEGPQPAE